MNQMWFPKTIKEFIDDYSFKDKKEVYTNGSQLIQTFRVEQALNHYYQPYKDFEDELGIDLATLFKALKNGIIYKTDYGYDKGDYHWSYIDAKYISLGMSYYEPFLVIKLEQQPDIEQLELSNYGKTWKLTEEN